MRDMLTRAAWLVLVTVVGGCSTANLDDAVMARDAEGKHPTTVFGPTDTFHCLVALRNAPEGTKVKAVFTCIEAPGYANREIDSTEIVSESGPSQSLHFELSLPGPWPVGKYKVDLYLDGKLDRTLAFEVAEEAAG